MSTAKPINCAWCGAALGGTTFYEGGEAYHHGCRPAARNVPPMYDESDYEALRAEKDERIAALEEELACRTDGFWKREEECDALAERLNRRDAELAAEREHPTNILQCAACQRIAVVKNAELTDRAEQAEVELTTLKAENAKLRTLLTDRPTTLSAWDNAVLDRAEKAEAEINLLKDEFSNNNWKQRAERAEAELAAMTRSCDGWQHDAEVYAKNAEQAEAELAAAATTINAAVTRIATLEAENERLKCCGNCNDGDAIMGTDEEPRVYCGWHSMWWPSTAYCSQWTAREDG